MNILISSASYFYTDYQAGGENRVTAGIVSELDRRGHTIHLFAPRIDIRNPLPNTTCHELGQYRFDPSIDELRYRIEWWKYSIRSYVAARRLIRDTPIDLIHHIRPGFLGRFSLCHRLGKPFLYGPLTPTWENTTEDDFDLPTNQPSLGYRIRYHLFSRLDGWLAPWLWNHMLEGTTCLLAQIPKSLVGIEGPVNSRTRMVGLATDTQVFSPSKDRFDTPTILFLAKLNRRKGLDYLIRAMPAIIERIPNAKLRVVGDGPARDYFESVASECEVTDSVDFLGMVEHAETVKYFGRADVYCLPSVGEPAANSLLEAMACGCPIVSTAAGGVPEIVDHEQGGLLVPPRDADALAVAILRILENAEESESMRAHNLKASAERHTIEGLVDRIETAYRDALEGHG